MATLTIYHQTDPSVAFVDAGGGTPTPNFGTTGANGFDAGGTVQFARQDGASDSTINDRNISGATGVTPGNGKGWDVAPLAADGSTFVNLTKYRVGDLLPIGTVINTITPSINTARFTGTGTDTWRLGLFTAGQATPGAFNAHSQTTAFQFVTNGTALTGASSGVATWASGIVLSETFHDSFGCRMFGRRTGAATTASRVDFISLTFDYTAPTTVVPANPIHRWENVRDAFDDMDDPNVGGVHVIGFGDSNWAIGGYGHKKAAEKALGQRFTMRSLGLVPMDVPQYGGAFTGMGYAATSGFSVSDPDTARNALDNNWGHAFVVSGCSLTGGAGLILSKTGAFAGIPHDSTGQIYVDHEGGSPTVTGGIYSFTDSDDDTITLATSPTAGSDKTGNVRVSEVLISSTDSVRGNVRNALAFGYIYKNDAASIAAGTAGNLAVSSTCPMAISGPLQFTVFYGTFAAGTGTFSLQGLKTASSLAAITITGGQNVNPVTGSATAASAVGTITADASRTDATFGVTRATDGSTSGSACNGPFFGTLMKLERTDLDRGFDFNTFYQQGGECTLDMLRAAQTITDAQIDYYIACRRGSGTAPHTWILMVQSGGNDRNETVASRGAYADAGIVFVGSSRNAFRDNLLALYLRFRARILANYAGDKVRLLSLVTHPHYTAGVEDTDIAGYRQAAYNVADERTDMGVVDWTNSLFGTASDWAARYAAGPDNAHIGTDADFDVVWGRLVDWIADRVMATAARSRDGRKRGWFIR